VKSQLCEDWKEKTMKYMLMMTGPWKGYEPIGTWPKEDVRAHIQHMMTLNKELMALGEFVLAEGLAMAPEAKLVRAEKDGTPITDGVFPESKEFLAGFWIVDVESPERAYAIAAKASAAPYIGGVPMNMPIEVRQVLGRPPLEYV
jgi:hypothetical protein